MYIYTHIHTHSGSFAAAQALISANAQREASFDIDVRFQAAHLNILTGVLNEGETIDFCMCNPPFFASAGAPCPPPSPSPHSYSRLPPIFFSHLGTGMGKLYVGGYHWMFLRECWLLLRQHYTNYGVYTIIYIYIHVHTHFVR